MDNNEVPYLLRGLMPAQSESSVLKSTSRYLNNAALRDWLVTTQLRRNGKDFPVEAEMHYIMRILEEIRAPEQDRIEALFAEERKKNAAFDAWMSEGFLSTFKREDFKDYPPDTVGGKFYKYLIDNNFETQLERWGTPKTSIDFYQLRGIQQHDFEHIVTGGSFDYMGEVVTYWARLSNPFVHLSPELAGEVSVLYIFCALRYVTRTILHYPHIWPTAMQSMQRGMDVGKNSGPMFMAKYEPVFELTVPEARDRLGVRNAIDLDTAPKSKVWAEQV